MARHRRTISSPLLYFFLTTCTTARNSILSSAFITRTARHHQPSHLIVRAMSFGTHACNNPMDGLPQPLLLGSGSFTRKLILTEMNIPFHVLVRPIDERNIGNRETDSPQELVVTLAKAKADHLLKQLQNANIPEEELPSHVNNNDTGWIVLTGDQVVTHDECILEKPLDIAEAKSFVARYADSPPSTVGSVVLTHVPSGIQVSGVDSATIVFKQSVTETVNGLDLVDRLLQDDAPVLSCAGGLMVEHPYVKEHLERIEGTEDSVMGLSKDLVLQLLEEMRVKLKEAKVIT